jgi:DNA primase
MDLISIFISHDIRYWTEGKNVSPGWVNVRCPFCGDKSNHGGFNLSNGKYSCWRCGSDHSAHDVLKELTGFNLNFSLSAQGIKKKKANIEPKSFERMPGVDEPKECHRQYLRNRGFDLTIMKELYKIKFTIHTPVRYQWRIMIPIFDADGKYLSYQGRDVTGQQEKRYIDEPGFDNKATLYGEWLIDDYENILVVEGVFDSWKLGVGSVASYGISYSMDQVLLLSKYKNVFIMFDNEKTAQRQARKLCAELRMIGTNAVIVPGPERYKDAGAMPANRARELKKMIFNGEWV